MTQEPSGGTGDQPPAAPAYGQPPAPPSYGEQPPQAPPAYGAPPQYGQQPPPPAYGQQPPQQGAPQQQYGAPPAGGYGQPAPPQQPYNQQQPYGAPAVQQPLRPEEERQYAMFAHLGGILGILPSLIIYLVFKDRGPFVKDQAREALNFQITMLFAYVAAVVLTIFISIVAWTPVSLNWIVWILSVVFSVIGGMAANRGETYRYPFAVRLVS
jgi:uncharacterized protein